MGNHLWQSTLCLVVAGLLTLILRKNRARARYGLWLAASVKFLIPFSLLIAIGSSLARPRVLPPTEPGFFLAMQEISQPFAPSAAVVSPVVHSATFPNLEQLIPAILVAAWFCGFVVVLSVWYGRWRRASAAMREAVPLREGREVETLRRLERLGGIRKPIELLLSPANLEPGVFGIVRPVLLWPKGISGRLDGAHLEAILAHEVWHVRHRDNLAAAIHMVVEALFWFHPLVWWLGSRLVEERERACDEQVLELGSERQVYAESILRTCEFCVESPVACVSGVTGADLKKRIFRIMTQRSAEKLAFGRKLLLAAIGLAAVAGPVVFGLMNAPPIRGQSPQTTGASRPTLEVASIRPSSVGETGPTFRVDPQFRFIITGTTTRELIAEAYNVKDYQISGGPSWINSEKYDIDAKEHNSRIAELQKLPFEQLENHIRLMDRSLLADRFKLMLSHDTKELPVYTLTIANNGCKLQQARPDQTYTPVPRAPDGRENPYMFWGKGQLIGEAVPIETLVSMLSQELSRPVLDQTRLKGIYNIRLQWTPDQSQAMYLTRLYGPQDFRPGADSASLPESSGPSLLTAIQEQLGLKLELQKGPLVEVLVIDHIERPPAN
jgi:uncharacterized protein (TIGR03435 family)